jgi:uncharacterized protein
LPVARDYGNHTQQQTVPILNVSQFFIDLFGLPGLTVAVLVAVAAVAGFVDSIAGGGGLLTVPATLMAGLPQVDALATNKLQSSFGSFSATLTYARAGQIDFRAMRLAVAWTFAGAVLGAATVSMLPVATLKTVLPALLVAVAVYFVFSPRIKDESTPAKMPFWLFAPLAGGSIGFYDGVFGPGTGSFFTLAFVGLLGFGALRATAHTKLLNFTSNIAALLFFFYGGHVHVVLGLAMGAGQFLGARLGAGLAIRHGARLIRPLLALISISMAAKLAYDAWLV